MRVRLHADLVDDVKRQIADPRGPNWTQTLSTFLDGAIDSLAYIPQVELSEARLLPVRRNPFALWFVIDEHREEVWALRLFHVDQARPRGRRR